MPYHEQQSEYGMQLNKPLKLLIGLVTLWPPIYMVIFISFAFTAISNEDPDSEFKIIFALHFLTMAVTFALMIFYFVYLFKYAQIKQDSKIMWAILFFVGGLVTFPIFWYLYIWQKRDSEYEPSFATSTNRDKLVCPKCSKNVSDTWRVCPHCGESLVEILGYYCSKCGKDVEEGWNVCAHCGESL